MKRSSFERARVVSTTLFASAAIVTALLRHWLLAFVWAGMAVLAWTFGEA